MTRYSAAALAVSLVLFAHQAAAQERELIGVGRLFTNDYIGDGSDRWRSGSYVSSYVLAPQPFRGTELGFGDLLELRFRGEIIAPQGNAGSPGDRPYVGALSFGLHTHYSLGVADVSVGGDLVAVGPQTRLAQFQRNVHEVLDLPQVRSDNQIGDEVFFNATVAAGTALSVSDRVRFHPFVELRGGVEDVVRVGGDVLIGNAGVGALYLRDEVTGQLYQGTSGRGEGWSFSIGGDVAQVGDSAYLPSSQGYALTDTLSRARVGVRYQTDEGTNLFYGLTHISQEFEGQPEAQTVGSLTLNFTF